MVVIGVSSIENCAEVLRKAIQANEHFGDELLVLKML